MKIRQLLSFAVLACALVPAVWASAGVSMPNAAQTLPLCEQLRNDAPDALQAVRNNLVLPQAVKVEFTVDGAAPKQIRVFHEDALVRRQIASQLRRLECRDPAAEGVRVYVWLDFLSDSAVQ